MIGLLIKVRDLKIGLARAETIRRNIFELREKGKNVFVYIESGGNIEYLISSAAESIYISPWAILNLIGLKAEVVLLKDSLDKIGIEAQFKGLGEYKSAAETFTRNSMSEPNRQMLNSIIEDLYNQFIHNISSGRKIEEQTIKKLIDSGPFTSGEALENGLVDGIGYEDEFEIKIKEILKVQIKAIKPESLLRLLNIKDFTRNIIGKFKSDLSVIAVFSDSGMITHGESKGTGGAKILGSQTITKILYILSKDKNIKAIVLRILSPGGSGIASDLIRHHLKIISNAKPVVVSMSDVAASGGYMIALGANKIVAEPLTLTGSIGIISGKFNLKYFYKKLGVVMESVKRGRSALMFSTYGKFTKNEEENLNKIMKSLYDEFVNKVAVERKMDIEHAERISRGRVWTGKQAKKLGLIDELGGINVAIQVAKKEAGIPEKTIPTVKFISKPKGIHFSPISKSMALKHLENFIEAIYQLHRESVLTLMPFWINFR
ncbi:MAG: signal peptide peptidase SppA [Thermodesulfobacteriota bacterium]